MPSDWSSSAGAGLHGTARRRVEMQQPRRSPPPAMRHLTGRSVVARCARHFAMRAVRHHISPPQLPTTPLQKKITRLEHLHTVMLILVLPRRWRATLQISDSIAISCLHCCRGCHGVKSGLFPVFFFSWWIILGAGRCCRTPRHEALAKSADFRDSSSRVQAFRPITFVPPPSCL